MSDLFHKNIPKEFITGVFDTMEMADWHVFQVLTRRSSLMRRFVNERYAGGQAPEHIWLGTSIEDHTKNSRVGHLQQTNASVRFLSVEPLIGEPGMLELTGIRWVIVGGESGPKPQQLKFTPLGSSKEVASSL